ncbi:hypothetical protein SCHPADRAFT_926661 [Schizopora paradoxa]|uniref:Uncharacterized protein n=1 Tax=Schizopora paradoxa TaxID=27342 RepID=A0A0H2RWR0_9AGAM|nr:hypothetical protein SCHPADRAFT_926661 [Schizopora paradoxa]
MSKQKDTKAKRDLRSAGRTRGLKIAKDFHYSLALFQLSYPELILLLNILYMYRNKISLAANDVQDFLLLQTNSFKVVDEVAEIADALSLVNFSFKFKTLDANRDLLHQASRRETCGRLPEYCFYALTSWLMVLQYEALENIPLQASPSRVRKLEACPYPSSTRSCDSMPGSAESANAYKREAVWNKLQIGIIKKTLASGRILRWILFVFADLRMKDHATYVAPYPYGGITLARELIAMTKCSFVTDQAPKSKKGFYSVTTSHMQNVAIFRDGLDNMPVRDPNLNALQGGVASRMKIVETHGECLSEALESLVVEAMKTQIDEKDTAFSGNITEGLSFSMSELWWLQKPIPRERVSLSLTVPLSKIWWQILLDLKLEHVQARRAIFLSRENFPQDSFLDVIALSEHDKERLYEFVATHATPFPASSSMDTWLNDCTCADKGDLLSYLYGTGKFKHGVRQ